MASLPELNNEYLSRYDYLSKQIYNYREKYSAFNSSFERILYYLLNYTNVTDIKEIDENILYDYIKYHEKCYKFSVVLFRHVIKDIKYFQIFLRNEYGITLESLDLSTQNYKLWLSKGKQKGRSFL